MGNPQQWSITGGVNPVGGLSLGGQQRRWSFTGGSTTALVFHWGSTKALVFYWGVGINHSGGFSPDASTVVFRLGLQPW